MPFGERVKLDCCAPSMPASPVDLKVIVDARKKFNWRHIGFDPNGDSLFEVASKSEIRIPYLSKYNPYIPTRHWVADSQSSVCLWLHRRTISRYYEVRAIVQSVLRA
jgi:hypothetical protein